LTLRGLKIFFPIILKEKPMYIIMKGEKLYKKIILSYSMDRNNLNKLSKQQLIELLLKKENKPIPKPRKSVKQLVKEYENKTTQPPPRYRDLPIAAPRNKITPPPPQFGPVPTPRTKKIKLNKALKGAVKSYEVDIKKKDPLIQLNSTSKWIETYLKRLLNEVKGLKLVETIKIIKL